MMAGAESRLIVGVGRRASPAVRTAIMVIAKNTFSHAANGPCGAQSVAAAVQKTKASDVKVQDV